MAIKNARRWGKSKCGRSVTIEERFFQVENKDRRVQVGRIYCTSDLIGYLRLCAEDKNISMSFMFEKIFLESILGEWVETVRIPKTNKSSRKYVKLMLKEGEKMKFPKIYMHPVFLEMLKLEAQNKRMSLSLYVYNTLLAYKAVKHKNVCFE